MLPVIFSRCGGIVFAATALALTATSARADLLVLDTGGSGHSSGYVWRFDENTGQPRVGMGVENEGFSALAATNAGEVLVTSNVLGTYSLHRFDAQGGHRGSVSDVWFGQMRGMTRGPDGILYALQFDDANQRWRIAQLDGANVGIFIDQGGEVLASPVTMALAAGNTFLVVDRERGVLRFNALTGAFLDVLIPLGRGGLVDPTDLVVGSDGALYLASGELNAVLRFDGSTGGFINRAVESGSGGLANPQGLAFASNGDLLVTSRDTQQVLRFAADSGAFRGVAAELPHVRYAGRLVVLQHRAVITPPDGASREAARYSAMRFNAAQNTL